MRISGLLICSLRGSNTSDAISSPFMSKVISCIADNFYIASRWKSVELCMSKPFPGKPQLDPLKSVD